MTKPYSYDLRLRVMKFLEDQNTIKEAAKLFNINRTTIIKWKKLKKETGDVKAKIGYQKGHTHMIKDLEEFREFLQNNKDKSIKELSQISGKYAPTTIWRGIKKLGLSYKKNFYSSKER